MVQLIGDKLKKILKTLPKNTGIYQFFNIEGKIIYIGKSVNLKSRVNSYFNGKSKLNFAKQKMVEQIKNIEYIITQNETESLILETNLIKQNLPKYNILMKDGKNHVYIKITDEDFPKIIKVRIKNGKGEYFGPYISSNDIDNILKVLKKVFGYGVGKNNFFKNKTNYNLDKYLFEGNIDLDDENKIKKIYFEKLEEIKLFLKGNYKKVIENLREQMMIFAMNHEFERADILKKQIESIEVLNEKQIVREGILGDYNIVNYIEKFDKIFIGKIEIRNSKIVGFYPYEIENNLGENLNTILEKFVKNLYLNSILSDPEGKKPILIISKEIKLKEKLFSKIRIENPKIGTKQDLLKMCYKNIYEFAYKKHIDSLSTKSFTKTTMKNLLEVLNFERINKDIIFECNDISHFSGTHTVASRSIIENGKTNPSKYRKFNIKSLKEQEINDFDSMREIAKRRIEELKKIGNYPDLIIIDGGKPQLSSVYEIFKKNKLEKNIQLVGIAKKEEILYKIKEIYPLSEYLPLNLKKEDYKFEEIKLKKDSLELRLIQKIRDEAHRFAITFNRDSRSKTNKKNILESLPGIGPKTRKFILKEFGSVEKLSEEKKENLEKVLNKNIIEILENHGVI